MKRTETHHAKKDLTTGSVFKNVLYFSLPYLLSYFLQTLYGMADLFIIGQFEGTASITAVSIGSQILHMITVMLVGWPWVLPWASAGQGAPTMTGAQARSSATRSCCFWRGVGGYGRSADGAGAADFKHDVHPGRG